MKQAFRNKNTREPASSSEEGAGEATEGPQAARADGYLLGPGSTRADEDVPGLGSTQVDRDLPGPESRDPPKQMGTARPGALPVTGLGAVTRCPYQEGPCAPGLAVPTPQVVMGTKGEGGCWGPCTHTWDNTPSDSPWRVPGAEHRRGGHGSYGRKMPTCLAPISGKRPGASTVEAERPRWPTGGGGVGLCPGLSCSSRVPQVLQPASWAAGGRWVIPCLGSDLHQGDRLLADRGQTPTRMRHAGPTRALSHLSDKTWGPLAFCPKARE